MVEGKVFLKMHVCMYVYTHTHVYPYKNMRYQEALSCQSLASYNFKAKIILELVGIKDQRGIVSLPIIHLRTGWE